MYVVQEHPPLLLALACGEGEIARLLLENGAAIPPSHVCLQHALCIETVNDISLLLQCFLVEALMCYETSLLMWSTNHPKTEFAL